MTEKLENQSLQEESSKEQEEKKVVKAPATTARRKSVYIYVTVLFTATFFLLLWSFLSNHRSNQIVIRQLRDSSDVLQTTLEKNNSLEVKVESLQMSLQRMEENRNTLKDETETMQKREDALQWLLSIQYLLHQQQKEEARSLLEQFEQTGLVESLGGGTLLGMDKDTGISSITLYQSLKEELAVNEVEESQVP